MGMFMPVWSFSAAVALSSRSDVACRWVGGVAPAPVDLSVELSDVAAVAVHPVFLKKRLASAAGTRTSQTQHTAAQLVFPLGMAEQ